MREEYIRLVTI